MLIFLRIHLLKMSLVKRGKWHFRCCLNVLLQSETRCEAISHLRISHNAPCSPPTPHLPQILDNLCFSFLLGITASGQEKLKTVIVQNLRGWGGGKQVLLWEMCKWRIDLKVRVFGTQKWPGMCFKNHPSYATN